MTESGIDILPANSRSESTTTNGLSTDESTNTVINVTDPSAIASGQPKGAAASSTIGDSSE
jgi:hypothetical protein